jgi:hypothetical protein
VQFQIEIPIHHSPEFLLNQMSESQGMNVLPLVSWKDAIAPLLEPISIPQRCEGCLYQEGGELNLRDRGFANGEMANGSKSPVHSLDGVGFHDGAIVAISLAPIHQFMMGGGRSFGDRRIAGFNVEAVTTVN